MGNALLGESFSIYNCIPVEYFCGILLLPMYCYSQAVTTATAIIIVYLVNLHGEIKIVSAGNITIISSVYAS